MHDLDHQGVPNIVLMKEGSPLVDKYDSKSLAEQNSIDLAWGLLSQPKYHHLLQTICGNQEDFLRFRQLLVNAVCATDIAGKLQAGCGTMVHVIYWRSTNSKLVLRLRACYRQGAAGCSQGSLAGSL